MPKKESPRLKDKKALVKWRARLEEQLQDKEKLASIIRIETSAIKENSKKESPEKKNFWLR